MEGGDEPVLLLHLPLLSRQEVDDVLMPEVHIGEDVFLVFPGGVLLVREDLHGHRLKLIRGGLFQLCFVHLGKATLTHLKGEQKG